MGLASVLDEFWVNRTSTYNFTEESRLLRVNLPIDVTFTDGDSLFVLGATAGFGEPTATTKVLFEVSISSILKQVVNVYLLGVANLQFPKSGGADRRSASMVDLFGGPGFRAVSINAGPNDQLVVVASNGQWVLIDKVCRGFF